MPTQTAGIVLFSASHWLIFNFVIACCLYHNENILTIICNIFTKNERSFETET